MSFQTYTVCQAHNIFRSIKAVGCGNRRQQCFAAAINATMSKTEVSYSCELVSILSAVATVERRLDRGSKSPEVAHIVRAVRVIRLFEKVSFRVVTSKLPVYS